MAESHGSSRESHGTRPHIHAQTKAQGTHAHPLALARTYTDISDLRLLASQTSLDDSRTTGSSGARMHLQMRRDGIGSVLVSNAPATQLANQLLAPCHLSRYLMLAAVQPCTIHAMPHLPLYICTYICIYIFVHICKYIYVYKYMCMYVCMYIYIYMYIYVCIHIYIYTYTCMYICIHVHIYIHMHMYTYIIIYTCTSICVCMYVYICVVLVF